jgi:hypothetical protein
MEQDADHTDNTLRTTAVIDYPNPTGEAETEKAAWQGN